MVSTILRGGLGNNLFQMACAFAHAKRNGYEYAIPLQIENPHYEGQKPYVFSGLNYCDKLPDLPRYKEKAFHYNPINAGDNIVLDGYFQSELYFQDYKDEFIAALGLNIEPLPEWCAVHVRRGDYLRLPDHHPFVGEKYLNNSLYEMYLHTGISQFKIFSNDPDWCKEFFNDEDYMFDFEIIEGNNEVEDLKLGAACQTQILSNGTFALWQNYLNPHPERFCIGPQRWFGKALDHKTHDLYPTNCLIIPNE